MPMYISCSQAVPRPQREDRMYFCAKQQLGLPEPSAWLAKKGAYPGPAAPTDMTSGTQDIGIASMLITQSMQHVPGCSSASWYSSASAAAPAVAAISAACRPESAAHSHAQRCASPWRRCSPCPATEGRPGAPRAFVQG